MRWVESESEVVQSCLTLCDPVNCSPPGSSIHGILQAGVGCHSLLLPDSGSNLSLALAGGFFHPCTTWEAQTDRQISKVTSVREDKKKSKLPCALDGNGNGNSFCGQCMVVPQEN